MTPQLGARFGQHPSAFVEHGFVQRGDEEPVSRTYQYRKVMKPMLERKRRARINRCLDELKELMVTALQAEGENVAKLEKADILELTVRHLHGLRRQGRLIAGPEGSYAERFKAGFSHCASEVTQFITGATNTPRNTPVEAQAGERLLQHLNGCIRRLESTTPLMSSHQNVSPSADFLRGSSEGVRRLSSEGGGEGRRAYAPPSPPASPASSSEHAYSMWRPW